MAQVRRRVKHTLTFEERLAAQARQFREEAEKLPLGSKARDLILRRPQQAEAASRINEWLRSPGCGLPRSERVSRVYHTAQMARSCGGLICSARR
jgi:hypothetical protein